MDQSRIDTSHGTELLPCFFELSHIDTQIDMEKWVPTKKSIAKRPP